MATEQPTEGIFKYIDVDAPRLLLHQSVGEALDALREKPVRGGILYLYVVDMEGRPCGAVPTRRLLLEPYSTLISAIMTTDVVAVAPDASVLEVARLLKAHKLLALPVVDAKRRMLGVVDASLFGDVLPQAVDAQTRDNLFQTIGVHAKDAKCETVLAAFRQRFPWLGCNLGAGILAAFLAGRYQVELAKAVALSFFIPVVLNLAESVSSQSVSLALDRLQGEAPSWAEMVAKLRRESVTGAMLGLGSGVIVGLVAFAWLGNLSVVLCLIAGIAGGVTGAALLGLSMPYLLRLLKLDPQVAAGPIALAGADVMTLLIYLNAARWLLK